MFMPSMRSVKGRSAGWAIQYAQARQKRREGGKESKSGAILTRVMNTSQKNARSWQNMGLFLPRLTLRTLQPCRR